MQKYNRSFWLWLALFFVVEAVGGGYSAVGVTLALNDCKSRNYTTGKKKNNPMVGV